VGSPDYLPVFVDDVASLVKEVSLAVYFAANHVTRCILLEDASFLLSVLAKYDLFGVLVTLKLPNYVSYFVLCSFEIE
jgi:hypothetical protein